MDIIDAEYTQDYVDNLLMQAEEKAELCNNEETALTLLQDIQHLNYLSKFFFVPAIVFSWEEMALSYVESEDAIFEVVHLPEMQRIYERGFDALLNLEAFTLDEGLSENVLFNLVFNFNLDVRKFNQSCKQYHTELFQPYYIQDHKLYTEYKKFMESYQDE